MHYCSDAMFYCIIYNNRVSEAIQSSAACLWLQVVTFFFFFERERYSILWLKWLLFSRYIIFFYFFFFFEISKFMAEMMTFFSDILRNMRLATPAVRATHFFFLEIFNFMAEMVTFFQIY